MNCGVYPCYCGAQAYGATAMYPATTVYSTPVITTPAYGYAIPTVTTTIPTVVTSGVCPYCGFGPGMCVCGTSGAYGGYGSYY